MQPAPGRRGLFFILPWLVVTGVLVASLAGTPAVGKAREVTFAFWNVENLFDTEDDPKNKGDNEYLPAEGWTPDIYALKLEKLASVILEISPDILAVCEVENRRVLEDLIGRPELKKLGYSVIHRDSPDSRGIDLGLLIRDPVRVRDRASIRLHEVVPRSRGILEVPLTVNGDAITVFVNHWPSRRGGVEKSEPFRRKHARHLRNIVDAADPELPILILGDFNDEPFDPSIREDLRAVRSLHAVQENRKFRYLFNPMWKLYGEPEAGTYYYNREWRWNVLDQCIVNPALVDGEGLDLVPESVRVHGPKALRDSQGRPAWFRKNRKGAWSTGYSDHFPILGRMRY